MDNLGGVRKIIEIAIWREGATLDTCSKHPVTAVIFGGLAVHSSGMNWKAWSVSTIYKGAWIADFSARHVALQFAKRFGNADWELLTQHRQAKTCTPVENEFLRRVNMARQHETFVQHPRKRKSSTHNGVED